MLSVVNRSKISLRSASLRDASNLFDWRNDPIARENSPNSEPLEWNDHVRWLKESLQNKNRKILIAYCNGRAVGTVRFDYGQLVSIVSWNVAPDHRGKGIGTDMLKLAIELHGTSGLTAFIKEGNAPSRRIAAKCGFQPGESECGVTEWFRP